MSAETMTADESRSDPLKSVADAMATAMQAVKDGASDAQTRVSDAMPAVSQFLSRFTYTTFYGISYGIVFPTMLVVRSIPKENCIVQGLTDGGAAAREAVMERWIPHAGIQLEGGESGPMGDAPPV